MARSDEACGLKDRNGQPDEGDEGGCSEKRRVLRVHGDAGEREERAECADKAVVEIKMARREGSREGVGAERRVEHLDQDIGAIGDGQDEGCRHAGGEEDAIQRAC